MGVGHVASPEIVDALRGPLEPTEFRGSVPSCRPPDFVLDQEVQDLLRESWQLLGGHGPTAGRLPRSRRTPGTVSALCIRIPQTGCPITCAPSRCERLSRLWASAPACCHTEMRVVATDEQRQLAGQYRVRIV
jgi:hypothetical protein